MRAICEHGQRISQVFTEDTMKPPANKNEFDVVSSLTSLILVSPVFYVIAHFVAKYW
jgi:lipopolysaccharide/colanic/teichoic acid biosynthesis glycosyltransferase